MRRRQRRAIGLVYMCIVATSAALGEATAAAYGQRATHHCQLERQMARKAQVSMLVESPLFSGNELLLVLLLPKLLRL